MNEVGPVECDLDNISSTNYCTHLTNKDYVIFAKFL